MKSPSQIHPDEEKFIWFYFPPFFQFQILKIFSQCVFLIFNESVSYVAKADFKLTM